MKGRWLAWTMAAGAAAALLAAGCATGGGGEGRVARVRGRPGSGAKGEVGGWPGDWWVLGAFFGASGVEVGEAELEEMRPRWGAGRVRGGGETAMRRVAARHGLAAANVPMGMDGLRRALDEGTCVMVAVAGRAGIPVSRADGAVLVRTGGGREERWDEEVFEVSWNGRGMVLIDASKAARRLPDGREERLALGEYWLGTGETGRAAKAFGAASEGDAPGDARGALGAGTAAAREGRWEEASGCFGRALALEPDNARAMNNAAYARLRRGEETEEALALAEAAVAAQPGNPVYLETLAEALLAMDDGRAERAAKCLERAWARGAKLQKEERIEILVQLERAWLAAGRPDLASQVRAARERAEK